jgi:hypothetical protein
MAGPFDGMVTGNVPLTPEGMALRQRLALAMIGGSKKGYPKNLGEGLTSIGDALGERMQMNQLTDQMAQLERASANRGVRPAVLPAAPAAVPGSNDPSTGQQSAAPATVQTVDASPQMPTIAPTQADASAAPATAAAVPASWLSGAVANNADYQSADALPPVQDAGGAPQLASADTGTVSDAAPVGAPTGQPNPAAVRASIAQLMQTRQGGSQPNPMLAGQSPASAPSTISPDPALLGSPLEPNRPIETDIQPFQVAEAGTKPAAPVSLPPPDQMPPAVKLPGASSLFLRRRGRRVRQRRPTARRGSRNRRGWLTPVHRSWTT